jgi:hypothetical protein
MRKVLLFLVIGIAAGYWWGFNDAMVNSDNVVVRLINRAGGQTRERLSNNVDGRLDSLERR